MRLFDKMFNYELQSALITDGAGQTVFPVTALEMEWLKQALLRGPANSFMQAETIAKLNRILFNYDNAQPTIVEKAIIRNPETIPPACFATLRQALRQQSGVRLVFSAELTGKSDPEDGWPLLLEFNMARREWYLVWLNVKERSLYFTPLRHVVATEILALADKEELQSVATSALEEQILTAVVEINPDFPTDRHRVLSALSAFNCDVELESGGVYRISIRYLQNEEEYLLQRIRFLGLRVHISAPERLIARMKDTVARIAELY